MDGFDVGVEPSAVDAEPGVADVEPGVFDVEPGVVDVLSVVALGLVPGSILEEWALLIDSSVVFNFWTISPLQHSKHKQKNGLLKRYCQELKFVFTDTYIPNIISPTFHTVPSVTSSSLTLQHPQPDKI